MTVRKAGSVSYEDAPWRARGWGHGAGQGKDVGLQADRHLQPLVQVPQALHCQALEVSGARGTSLIRLGLWHILQPLARLGVASVHVSISAFEQFTD